MGIRPRIVVTVVSITGLVRPESVMQVLQARLPSSFLDMNRKALDLGLQLGEPYAA